MENSVIIEIKYFTLIKDTQKFAFHVSICATLRDVFASHTQVPNDARSYHGRNIEWQNQAS